MKSIFKNHSFLVLLILTIVSGILRFWKLGSLPVSLNWDEVSHGYNALSILQTGKDEWGKTFPLIFRAFGDFKLPLYIYLSVIPVWLFGLNAFAVRFISAFAGTLAIPGIYLLTNEIFPNLSQNLFKRKINLGFLTALLLAILPWHFFISRPALEANLSLTLIIFGFYFLLKFFGNKASILPSVVLLGLSLHTYNTARVFVPLMVILSFLIYRPKIKINFKTGLSIFMALLFSGLVIFQVYLGEGTARYDKLKILSPSSVFQIGENRAQSPLPSLVARLIYNRPVYFLTIFSKNYLGYFSPDFFSQKWGAQYQFAIPKENLLTLPVFLLALLGFIFYLPHVKSDKAFQMLYAWLFLSPVAASLTIDPPQALRPNPMIPAVVILACLGLARLLVLIPEKRQLIFVSLFSLWTLLSFGYYLGQYAGDYKTKFSSSWQYGYEQVMDYISEHWSEYDRIFITKRYGEPHIFYVFFTGLSPEKLQPGPENIRYEKSDWFWTDKIDNVYFVNDWQIPTIGINSLPIESGQEISTARGLLVTSPDHVPVNAHVIETINFLDGSPAFTITSVP
ncbi:MAG: hypothetical protein ACD_61C00210G0003 [uncultured bacterium]|nr:MAG: hypothetical protein ACD_61C00210G0003 [uncultured bacterium]